MESVAERLVREFGQMVSGAGGELTLLGAEDDLISVGYRHGVDPDCADGTCVMPHVELEQLMTETLARRSPGAKVTVEVVQ